MCQPMEECLASRVGFRLCLTVILGILVTAIICNLQMMLIKSHDSSAEEETKEAVVKDATTKMMIRSSSPTRNKTKTTSSFKNHSTILLWTDHDSEDLFWLVLERRLTYLRSEVCPVLAECNFMSNKSRIHQADTVLIAAKRTFPFGGKASDKTWTMILPDPDYHRAYLNRGAKHNRHLNLKLLISYLPGSSIPLVRHDFNGKPIANHDDQIPSVQAVKAKEASKIPSDDKRLAVTIMDDCQTEGNRENYIEQLQQHVSVHIYGRCGAPCPGWVLEDCLKYLDEHYKFFLVFESHICQHFMSSDLWSLLSSTKNMVPVVFGGVNYADVIPKHVKFLDALNHSPEVLGHTMNYLASNASAMNQYTKWRQDYELSITEWPCEFCQYLRLNGGHLLRQDQEKTSNNAAQSSDGLCTSWPLLNFGGHHNHHHHNVNKKENNKR